MADRFGYGEIGLDIHPCKGCGDYVPPDGCKTHGGCAKPRTNADRIRAMSDEELAMELGWMVQDAFLYGAGERIGMKRYPFDNYESTLDWLQSPAEGGDGDAIQGP